VGECRNSEQKVKGSTVVVRTQNFFPSVLCLQLINIHQVTIEGLAGLCPSPLLVPQCTRACLQTSENKVAKKLYICFFFYYMASSLSGQDKSNPAL